MTDVYSCVKRQRHIGLLARSFCWGLRRHFNDSIVKIRERLGISPYRQSRHIGEKRRFLRFEEGVLQNRRTDKPIKADAHRRSTELKNIYTFFLQLGRVNQNSDNI